MPTDDRTARWNRYWDKKSRTYDREIGFFDRHLFGDSRQWVCSQATGDVLEVAPPQGDTLLVPFTKAAVPVVDLPGGRLVIDPVAALPPAGGPEAGEDGPEEAGA